MESTYRKPSDIQYEIREMTVRQYMLHAGLSTESAVYARIRKVDAGTISRDDLDYEQLAPGYPIKLFVRCRVPRSTIQ